MAKISKSRIVLEGLRCGIAAYAFLLVLLIGAVIRRVCLGVWSAW